MSSAPTSSDHPLGPVQWNQSFLNVHIQRPQSHHDLVGDETTYLGPCNGGKMNGGWNYFLLNYGYGPYDVLRDPNQLPATGSGEAGP